MQIGLRVMHDPPMNEGYDKMNSVFATMNKYVRMPYLNAWRLEQFAVEKNCFQCTTGDKAGA